MTEHYDPTTDTSRWTFVNRLTNDQLRQLLPEDKGLLLRAYDHVLTIDSTPVPHTSEISDHEQSKAVVPYHDA